MVEFPTTPKTVAQSRVARMHAISQKLRHAILPHATTLPDAVAVAVAADLRTLVPNSDGCQALLVMSAYTTTIEMNRNGGNSGGGNKVLFASHFFGARA